MSTTLPTTEAEKQAFFRQYRCPVQRAAVLDGSSYSD